MQGHYHLKHWDYKFSTNRRNLSYRCPEATENIFSTSSLSCFTSSFFCPPVNPLKGKIWICEGQDRKDQLYRKGCKYRKWLHFCFNAFGLWVFGVSPCCPEYLPQGRVLCTQTGKVQELRHEHLFIERALAEAQLLGRSNVFKLPGSRG